MSGAGPHLTRLPPRVYPNGPEVLRTDDMAATFRDSHRLLAGLNRDGVSLELSTLDICFLALHLRAERDGIASFE